MLWVLGILDRHAISGPHSYVFLFFSYFLFEVIYGCKKVGKQGIM